MCINIDITAEIWSTSRDIASQKCHYMMTVPHVHFKNSLMNVSSVQALIWCLLLNQLVFVLTDKQ